MGGQLFVVADELARMMRCLHVEAVHIQMVHTATVHTVTVRMATVRIAPWYTETLYTEMVDMRMVHEILLDPSSRYHVVQMEYFEMYLHDRRMN